MENKKEYWARRSSQKRISFYVCWVTAFLVDWGVMGLGKALSLLLPFLLEMLGIDLLCAFLDYKMSQSEFKNSIWGKLVEFIFLMVGLADLSYYGFLYLKSDDILDIMLGLLLLGIIGVIGFILFKNATDPQSVKAEEQEEEIKLYVTAEEVHRALGQVDTPLGKPWLGRVSPHIGDDSVIWGPTPGGAYIYGYNMGEELFLACNYTTEYLCDMKKAAEHTLGADASAFDGQGVDSLLALYEEMVQNYVSTGYIAFPMEKAENIKYVLEHPGYQVF